MVLLWHSAALLIGVTIVLFALLGAGAASHFHLPVPVGLASGLAPGGGLVALLAVAAARNARTSALTGPAGTAAPGRPERSNWEPAPAAPAALPSRSRPSGRLHTDAVGWGFIDTTDTTDTTRSWGAHPVAPTHTSGFADTAGLADTSGFADTSGSGGTTVPVSSARDRWDRESAPRFEPATDQPTPVSSNRLFAGRLVGRPRPARQSENAHATSSGSYRVGQGSSGRATAGLLLVGAVPLALLAVGSTLPWFTLTPTALLFGDFRVTDAAMTFLPLLVTCAVLLLCAAGMYRSPGCRWPVAAALVSAPWAWAGAQVLLASAAVGTAVAHLRAGTTVRVPVQLDAGAGSWALLAGGLTGLLWAAAALHAVHRAGHVHAGRAQQPRTLSGKAVSA